MSGKDAIRGRRQAIQLRAARRAKLAKSREKPPNRHLVHGATVSARAFSTAAAGV